MTIGMFSLLVDRRGCPLMRGLPLDEAVSLLGRPSRTNHDGGISNLVYEHSDPGAFWAFWFVDASLSSFEVHGSSARRFETLPSWFGTVEALELTVGGLASVGFSSIRDADAILCSGWSGSSYCQAVFFDEGLDRLIFGWSDGE